MTAPAEVQQPMPRHELIYLAERQRVQRGIEAAAVIVATARRRDLDAVHAMTAEMTHEGLRQLVATLACMVPRGTKPAQALAWLEEK